MNLTGWQETTIDGLCSFSNGHGFRPTDWKETGLPIIRIQNLNGSKEFNYYNGEPDADWIVEPGTLLFAWAGVRGVSFGPKIWDGPLGVLNQHIYRLTPKEGVNKYWLYSLLEVVTSRIEKSAHGFKTSLLHVRKADIAGQIVYLPTPSEQHKIAEILSTWDEAIDLTEQLIAAKQKRKQALMQQLLLVPKNEKSPKRRFVNFSGGWQQVCFGDVFERVTRKNTVGNENVLTISAQQGLINQKQFFNKIVASDSLSGYYLLKRGEFAYNKSYSEGYPLGAFKRLDLYEAGVLSTLYICFRIKMTDISSDYFVHFFEAGGMNHGIYSIAQEGARNHGLLNMSISDVFSLPIYVPSVEEQNQLASFFNELNHELSFLQQKLDALRLQKKGLMQQLLTGKLRVKV